MILAMNDSYKPILDREYANRMTLHFKDAIDLLNEVLDYGSLLLPRAYVSSPRDIKAICLVLVQLRQFLCHLDGLAILASAGNCSTANLQLRSLLEISHTMEWLLKADTEAKVNHLYVANIRKRRQWQTIAISGMPEAIRHTAAGNRLRLSLTADQLKEINKEVLNIDTILAKPEFSGINAKFGKDYVARGFDKPWYEVYGPPSPKISIRQIAYEIGKLEEYKTIYNPFSGITHGSDMWKNIVFGEKNMWINSLREPQDVPKTTKFAVLLALRVFGMVLQQYRPGEVGEDFARKYRDEWQQRFFKGYSVKITPQDTLI